MRGPKVVSRRREGEARQSEATKIMSDFDKIFSNFIAKKVLIDQMLAGHVDRFHWQIGTCHVYKNCNMQVKLSRFSDHLRKLGFKKILIVKELTEDRFPHYHFLVASPRKEGIHPRQPIQIATLKNHKIWSKPFEMGAKIMFSDQVEVATLVEDEIEYSQVERMRYSCITSKTNLNESIMDLDMGFKIRWMRFGLLNYIKYILKYFNSTKVKYEDYYVLG